MWQGILIIIGTLLFGAGVGAVLWHAEARAWTGDDDFPDSRFDPDIVGDHPHIPDDYRRELHQDSEKSWPESGEPRGA